jgi:hypothetical protein
MGKFYIDLFAQTWAAVLSALGTTNLAVIIFTILVPTIIWTCVIGYKWRYNMSPLKLVLKNSMPTAAITVGITIIVWAVIVGGFIIITNYNKHEGIAQKISGLEKEISAKSKTIKDMQTALDKNTMGGKEKKTNYSNDVYNSGPKTTSSIIYAGSGMFTGFIAYPDKAKECIIQAYDGIDKEGTPITPPIGSTEGMGRDTFQFSFLNGLYINMTGCTSYTITYRKKI